MGCTFLVFSVEIFRINIHSTDVWVFLYLECYMHLCFSGFFLKTRCAHSLTLYRHKAYIIEIKAILASHLLYTAQAKSIKLLQEESGPDRSDGFTHLCDLCNRQSASARLGARAHVKRVLTCDTCFAPLTMLGALTFNRDPERTSERRPMVSAPRSIPFPFCSSSNMRPSQADLKMACLLRALTKKLPVIPMVRQFWCSYFDLE